ncbi:MAG: hypothetical protein IKE01_06160 [Clostridia bacterium]|nr:hypothetical protein [Clostridia bacterium]
MPIITSGIFLPNGRFMPNSGDGHAKNANRFCDKYEKLGKLRDQSTWDADEFLVTAGCAIVASYNGQRCFKVARDNNCDIIKVIKDEYLAEGYELEPHWRIDKIAFDILSEIVAEMGQMKLTTSKGDFNVG